MRAEWLVDWMAGAIAAPYEWAVGRDFIARLSVFIVILPWTFLCAIVAFPCGVVFLLMNLWPGSNHDR